MKKQNLTLSIFVSISVLAAVTLLITGSLWINSIQNRFHIESKQIREIQIANMETQIKNSVDALVEFIEYRKKTTETVLKKELKERVHNVKSIIEGIYEKNKDSLSKNEIQEQIISTLRNIRFNDGRGYYFIDTLEGDVVLYPTIPESEGLNLIDLKDGRANYALRQEIDLVKSQDEGYIEGYWKKPGGTDQNFKKITYVQGFPPYNWYFGTGEYVDNVTIQIQNEIKEYVNQLTYGHLKQQYIFIHNMEGVEIANGAYPSFIGVNNFELEDLHGVKVYQDQIKLVQSKTHSGFLKHYWPTPSGEGQIEKLTYVTSIPDWNWVIGSGINMTSLDNLVASKKLELKSIVREQSTKIIILLVFIFIISVFIAKTSASSINKNISLFVKNMENSSNNLSMINLEKVKYIDFQELALVSNRMTTRINTLLHKDELTGLFNRRYINKTLRYLTEKATTNKTDLSLIMLDIDLFKLINDEYGHQIGDEVLVSISKIIQQTVREVDLVGRYGGEEVIIILPKASHIKAIQIANRIRENIESHIFEHIGKTVTISGGVATCQDINADKLIKQADDNLYEAKDRGRNQIVG